MKNFITLDRNEKITTMLKDMVNYKEPMKAIAARESFAAASSEIIQTVLNSRPVFSNLFTEMSYSENEAPFIDLDMFFDIKEANLIRVWAQQAAGGLVSSASVPLGQLPVQTYKLTGSTFFRNDQLRAANVTMVAKGLERLMQEVLVKQEINSFGPVAKAIAEATYLDNGVEKYQVLRTATAAMVKPADYIAQMTLMQLVNTSWVGDAPDGDGRAITDALCSPEFEAQVRLMAFEPINTRAATYGVTGTEKMRNDLYETRGTPAFMGVNLITSPKMGKGRLYNQIFSEYAGSKTYANYAGSGTAAFTPSTEQIVFMLNTNNNFLAKPIIKDGDTGSTFSVHADDQFARRADKIGFTGEVREGRVVLDARALNGLVF